MRFISRFTASHAFRRPDGRAGGTRTPNRRFWRPVLYQLSYCPSAARTPVTARAAKVGRSATLSPAAGTLPTAPRPETGPRCPRPAGPRGADECSARLFVEGVLAVPAAELGELDPLPVVLLVLHRDVVAALADLARQRHLHPLLVLRHDSCSFSGPRSGAGPFHRTGSGGGTRTRDNTIMSRVL